MEDDAPDGEIRALSAAVLYDGQVVVMLAVPGVADPVEHTVPGDDHTLLLNWDEAHPLPVDLDGVTAADRRCQRIVARGVRRLNEEMDRQRERLGRRRAEWPDGD